MRSYFPSTTVAGPLTYIRCLNSIMSQISDILISKIDNLIENIQNGSIHLHIKHNDVRDVYTSTPVMQNVLRHVSQLLRPDNTFTSTMNNCSRVLLERLSQGPPPAVPGADTLKGTSLPRPVLRVDFARFFGDPRL